jgi:xanthine dehydrogenase YagT iron-sulfur-binding subunit
VDSNDPGQLSRRDFVGITIAGSATLVSASAAEQQETRDVSTLQISLKINGQERKVAVDSRTTLLDLLRENLHLVGTKKGCDHGQCGACTVIVDGKRINSCLSLAVMNEAREVVTIEGLADGKNLHPMQAAFVKCDGLQCGYCTPGQICSAVAMLDELKTGAPSAVTPDISRISAINLTDDEIRERMSGNICRCGAYPGIVAAIRSVNDGRAA